LSQFLYINARFLTQPFSGVQRVGWELAKRLVQRNSAFKLISPQKRYWKRAWEYGKIDCIGKNKGVFWEQIELPLYLKKKRPLLINPGNTAPLLYDKNIVINHGLSWKRVPEAFSLKFRLWYDFIIPKVLKRASLILTVSEFCKGELIEEYKISEDKIKVLYPGISEVFKPLNIEKKNFILFVGNLQPYKNLQALIKAFCILKDRGYDIELWLAGSEDKRIFRDFYFGEVKESLQKDIKFLGFKDDEELVRLYNQAICLVLPSLYETFGLPVVEAMSCGCPVVVSDLPVFKEIVGDSAIYVNPHDPEEIAFYLGEIISSESQRKVLAQKGMERVKRFNWEITVDNFINSLKMI
jgi:glycosyltransferase involved in cell wall biosynthesis